MKLFILAAILTSCSCFPWNFRGASPQKKLMIQPDRARSSPYKKSSSSPVTTYKPSLNAAVEYKGCFRSTVNGYGSGDFSRKLGNRINVKTCTEICRHKGYRYAILQLSDVCYCKNSYGLYARVPDSDCNHSCPGEKGAQRCGGRSKSAVYTTGYEGCWLDSNTRAMVNLHIMMDYSYASVDYCLNICSKAELKYAGLQSGIHCFCGNEYKAYGKANDKECSMSCPAYPSQLCGGNWRNSVYRTDFKLR